MALESVTTTTTVSTVPSGTKIAADALAGGEIVQYVKSVDGRVNSELVIPGDSTYGWFQNLMGIASNAVAVNSGNKSDGTLRVVLATDQPALTNALHVIVDSGGGSGTQYTEDAASASDPVGNMLIARRRDTLSTSEVSADGDNIALNATNKGQLQTRDADANTTLTLVNTDTTLLVSAIANVTKVDDASFTPGTTKVLMMGYEFNNSSPDSVDEGDAGAARMSANRNQYIQIRDSAGNERGVNVSAGNALLVDASATTQPISAASLPLPALAATSTKQSDGSQKTQIVDGSGNVIGATSNALDVNIKSGASSGTQYTEDAASAADPVGNMLIARRRDTLTTSEVSADGDNIALNATNKGQLHVRDADANTNLGLINTDTTQLVSALVNAVKTDDAAFVPATTKVLMAGFEFNNSSPDSVDEGDAGAARMSANRNQYIQIRDSAGNERGVNVTAGNALVVDGSAVTQPVSIAGNQAVNIAQINGVTPLMGAGNTGTGSPRATLATDQASLPNWGQGGLAATAPSSATLQGLLGRVALPTAVTSGQLVAAMADFFGRMVVLPQAPRDLVADTTTTFSATTTETTIIAATASVFHDLTAIVVTNTSTSTDTRVDFRDATAGTVRFSLNVPAKQTVGMVLQVPRPQGAVNTNWTAQCATSTSDIRIFAQYVSNR